MCIDKEKISLVCFLLPLKREKNVWQLQGISSLWRPLAFLPVTLSIGIKSTHWLTEHRHKSLLNFQRPYLAASFWPYSFSHPFLAKLHPLEFNFQFPSSPWWGEWILSKEMCFLFSKERQFLHSYLRITEWCVEGRIWKIHKKKRNLLRWVLFVVCKLF